MMLAPETTSSTSAFHGLGCINSCCQAPPMCQEASYEDDDNIQSERTRSSSAHEPVNEGTNTTSSASEAMNMFSMLLTARALLYPEIPIPPLPSPFSNQPFHLAHQVFLDRDLQT